MLRLFVALPIPYAAAEALRAAQGGLIGARWAPLDNLHVTLRFAGEISEDRADDFDAALCAVRGSSFDVQLAGVGAFDDAGVVRAVWAGAETSEPLARLQRACDSAARRAGLKPERRTWNPHVTLAYLKGADAAQVGVWVRDHNLIRPPAFRARSFGLYSSLRSGGGSTYRLERLYPLA